MLSLVLGPQLGFAAEVQAPVAPTPDHVLYAS